MEQKLQAVINYSILKLTGIAHKLKKQKRHNYKNWVHYENNIMVFKKKVLIVHNSIQVATLKTPIINYNSDILSYI